MTCTERKVSCTKTIPCDRCIKHKIGHQCKREMVIVDNEIVNERVIIFSTLCPDSNCSRSDNISQGLHRHYDTAISPGSGYIISPISYSGCNSDASSSSPFQSPASSIPSFVDYNLYESSWSPPTNNTSALRTTLTPVIAPETQSSAQMQPPAPMQLTAPMQPTAQMQAALPILGWEACERILATCMSLAVPQRDLNSQADEQIAINVVMHGWDFARRELHVDTQWLWIKDLDDGLLYELPRVSRLAALIIVRMMANVSQLARSALSNLTSFSSTPSWLLVLSAFVLEYRASWNLGEPPSAPILVVSLLTIFLDLHRPR